MKASTLVTALAEKSLNMAYFPGGLNSSALRSYFISGEVYDQKIGEITRENATPCFITSPKRHKAKKKSLQRMTRIARELEHMCNPWV